MSRNKRISKVLSLLITMIMVLGYFTPFVHAEGNQISSAKVDLQEEALNKIMPEVAEDLEKDDLVEILVYMEDQVNTGMIAEATRKAVSSSMTPHNTKLAVRRGVVEALRDKAEISQVNLLKYLEQEKEKGNVFEYRPYHIVNMVYVKATKEVIKNISFMGEVEKIYRNKTHKLEKPIIKEDENELDSDDELEWNIERVKADKVWDSGIDGTGTVVGIIDSGVDWTHPALRDKWRGYDPETGETNPEGNWFDPVYNADLPADSDTHGTHVMGTAVGQEPDGSNKIGVAPGAKWIAARVFNTAGSTTDKILLDAAEWMLHPGGNPDNAPDVINNSWGGGAGKNDWYRDAVRAWRDAKIFPVFSAGNQRQGEPAPWSGSISVPSNYPESFAVAATDRNDIRGYFSKLGPSPYDEDLIKPEISAPGVSIRSSVPGGYAGGYSGTSMAAPHISGAVALLLSANSSLTVDEIEEIITNTATPLTDSTYTEAPNFGYGYGLINTMEAVQLATEGTGFIGGSVLQEGEDLEDVVIIHEQEVFEVYAGSNIDIIAEISDDVAVTNAELLVKQEGKSYWALVPMDRISGDHKYGEYKGTITYDLFTTDSTVYKIRAKDYAGREVATKDYKVDVNFGAIPDEYEEGFEDNPVGWTFNGSWEWGIPTVGPEPYEGGNVAGTNLDGNYPDKADDWLITPPLDLRDKKLKSATLRFHEWYEMENIFDRGHLLITDDYGENWTEVRPYITGEGKEWRETVINLGDYIGSKNPVFVGFRLTSDVSGNRVGWYIDNVRLVGVDNEPPATPIGLTAEASSLGIVLNWESVTDADFSHYNIYRSLDLEDGYELIEEQEENAFTDTTVEAGNTYYYKVAAVDYSGNISEFSEAAWTTALETTIIFGTDFEKDNGNFTTGVIAGTNNPWEWGIPTSGPNVAASGEKLWATNLSGNYDSRTDAYIESPTISLPSDKNAFLIFNHWVDMEAGTRKWDYGQVLVSNDDGITWVNVTPEPDGAYGGRIQEWAEEEISLFDYRGQDIKIRFFFHSDVSGNYLGWYVDDVYIIGIPNINGDSKRPADSKILMDMESGTNVGSYIKKVDNWNPVEPSYNLTRRDIYDYELVEDIYVQNIPMARGHGIPVEDAVVTVLETGRSVKADPATGKFNMRNPVGEYTLRAEAYGYYSDEAVVNVIKDEISNYTFMLEPKPKGNIRGRVYDRHYEDEASHAVIRVVEDGNIVPVTADENGNFTIEGIYEGRYTLKVVADGFEPGEVTIDIVGNQTIDVEVPLKRFIGFRDEIIYDDGTAEDALVVNGQSYGLAVRFTPSEYGKVTGANMYFWDTSFPVPGGTEIGVVIYDIDESGNVTKIGEPKVVNINRGKWNYIDLSEFRFATDRDFYISTIQTETGDYSPALGIDESSPHGDRSFLNINGDFRSLPSQGVDAGLMIRAIMENIADTPVITNLEEITYTNQDRIIAEGRVTADGKVNIYINGEKLLEIESENETFSVELDLVGEETVITATSELYGRETEPSTPITIIKDAMDPIIEVIKPLDGEKVNTELVHVMGNVLDKHLDKVLINDEIIEMDGDGSFHERLLVDSGENLIVIVAIDKAGNRTVVERRVYAGQDEPTIINIEPSEDIVLRPEDELIVSFEAPTGGEGYFKILMPFNLESNITETPMEEEDGLYRGTWIVPEKAKAEELMIEVVYISEYGIKTREIAPGRIKIELEEKPTESEPMESLPTNAVIVGVEAFDIRYLNNNGDAQRKLIEWNNEGKEIYIKLSEDRIVNIKGKIVGIDALPDELTYYDASGNIIYFEK